MTISAVILAGGKSLRMGRDKAWLAYKRQPLLCHQTETALRLGPAEIFIAGGSNPECARLGWPVLIDNFPGQGPLAKQKYAQPCQQLRPLERGLVRL